MKKIILLLMSTICLAGCTQKNAQTTSKEILNGYWAPTYLYNVGTAKIPSASSTWGAPFINFGKNNEVNGMSGVNLFGGSYNTEKEKISFAGMYSTRRAGECGQYEQKFLKALSEVDSYSIRDDELSLKKQGNVLIKFKKTTVPAKK